MVRVNSAKRPWGVESAYTVIRTLKNKTNWREGINKIRNWAIFIFDDDNDDDDKSIFLMII